ncbi:MAG: sensor histidine kinase [Bacillota bacterium]|nr:sensor histidine kinase [Bacillota bacterium]
MFKNKFGRLFIMDMSQAQRRRLAALKTTRYFAMFSILHQILRDNNTDKNITIVLIALVLVFEGNNYIRKSYLKRNRDIWFYFSYAVSVISLGFLSYRLSSFGTQLYNIVLLIELIVTEKKVAIWAVIFEGVTFCLASTRFDLSDIYSIGSIVFSYLVSLFIVLLFRNLVVEKVKVDHLNEELREVNLTLKEYTAKIEELTIAKERTRIAQELHDSIGHSLVALKMNLEYAENVVDLKPEKAKEVINKAQNLSKDCIIDLRKAVSLLKEEVSVEKLRQAIIELFQKFKETNSIRLNLDMEDSVEEVNPDIKNCIYKTVREAVTNGIKHGKATVFNVEILKSSGIIVLKVKNNGLECDTIVKSNGVRGIEDRINALGGKVDFISGKGIGFAIEATIPEL